MLNVIKKLLYFFKNFISTNMAKIKVKEYGKGFSVGQGTKMYGKGEIKIGRNCHIGGGSFFECRKEAKLIVGDDFSCTSNLFISCLGKVVIGNDVLFGNNIRIYDSNHGMDPKKTYRNQTPEIESVIIESGVWIGDNVIILPGVKIGEKAIIGAGSVVSRSIAPYTMAAGVPASAKKIYDFKRENWVKIGKDMCGEYYNEK